jgi:hypothetical protein
VQTPDHVFSFRQHQEREATIVARLDTDSIGVRSEAFLERPEVDLSILRHRSE